MLLRFEETLGDQYFSAFQMGIAQLHLFGDVINKCRKANGWIPTTFEPRRHLGCSSSSELGTFASYMKINEVQNKGEWMKQAGKVWATSAVFISN